MLAFCAVGRRGCLCSVGAPLRDRLMLYRLVEPLSRMLWLYEVMWELSGVHRKIRVFSVKGALGVDYAAHTLNQIERFATQS